jgi:lysophospholipase L1-like esterase
MKVVAWNVALTAVLAVLALAALEAWLRWTIPPMREGTLFQYTLESKRYKVMKPHADMRVYGTRVRTNDLGFRDNRAAVPGKRPGEFRIVVLGDSFTFGPGVEYEHLYTSLLQARLARAHPEAHVINLAVEGYNIVQYQAVLEEVGLRLEPDLVLVALFPVNDFEMDTYENNRRVAQGVKTPAPWQESLYVYRGYLHRVESAAEKVMHRLRPPAAPSGPDIGWEKNIAALKAIHTLAEARGVPVAVLLLPNTRGFETQREIFGRVDAHCRHEAMRCLDLLEVFRAQGVRDGALVLNAIDAHGNAEYHRVVAERVTPFVSHLIVGRRPAGQAL